MTPKHLLTAAAVALFASLGAQAQEFSLDQWCAQGDRQVKADVCHGTDGLTKDQLALYRATVRGLAEADRLQKAAQRQADEWAAATERREQLHREAEPRLQAERARQATEEARIAQEEKRKADEEKTRQEAHRIEVETQRHLDEIDAKKRAKEALEAKGYKPMTVEEFKVDGAALAKNNKKVAIASVFYTGQDHGFVVTLKDGGLPMAGFGDYLKIAVLDDQAPRDIRLRLMECRSHPVGYGFMGCPNMTILGHAVSCTLTNAFGATREDTCIEVEETQIPVY